MFYIRFHVDLNNQQISECVECECEWLWSLTVDADDFDHGDDEERQRLQLYFHQDGGQQKHQQNGHQTPCDPDLLRNSGGSNLSLEAEITDMVKDMSGWQ